MPKRKENLGDQDKQKEEDVAHKRREILDTLRGGAEVEEELRERENREETPEEISARLKKEEVENLKIAKAKVEEGFRNHEPESPTPEEEERRRIEKIHQGDKNLAESWQKSKETEELLRKERESLRNKPKWWEFWK